MLETGAFFLLVLWTAFCFAKMEIAIEGPHGWAEKLPTWQLPQEHWVSRIFFAGRPATGYHLWMGFFVISMLHAVFLFIPFSLALELRILSFFCFLSVAEDFLWFVLNPAFGISKFKPEHIWWHRRQWWLIAPRDYFLLLGVGTALFVLASSI